MEVRAIEASDMEAIDTWQALHNWQIRSDVLPETGFIIEGIAAGWVYETNSPVAILEPVIGNPLASKALRTEGLDRLLNHMVKWSQAQGYKHLVAATSHPSFINRSTDYGFKPLGGDLRIFWRMN